MAAVMASGTWLVMMLGNTTFSAGNVMRAAQWADGYLPSHPVQTAVERAV